MPMRLSAAKEKNSPSLSCRQMPGQAPRGLHGAVWFETICQDKKDATGKTLYAIYHNENYPATLPYDKTTGKGYINKDWPRGLTDSNDHVSEYKVKFEK